MDSVFNVIPNNFFNPLSSNSNYKINSVLLQFIYEQYDNEISYRIKRSILRDEMAYFISNNFDFFVSDSETAAKSYQDMASDYLRKFASKDVAWIHSDNRTGNFVGRIVNAIRETGTGRAI